MNPTINSKAFKNTPQLESLNLQQLNGVNGGGKQELYLTVKLTDTLVSS